MTEQTPAATVETTTTAVNPNVAVNGWAMWLFVLWPLIQTTITVLLLLLAIGLVRSGDTSVYGIASAITSDGFSLGLTVLSYVIGVLLVVADWRRLVRIGVPSPLPWQWGFLQTVYLIARGVVLHRRLGRGTLLTWLGLVIYVFDLVMTYSGLYDRFLLPLTT